MSSDQMTFFHSPEPWHIKSMSPDEYGDFQHSIRRDSSPSVVAMLTQAKPKGEGNANKTAQRIVDCVNACKGINPESVPSMKAALVIVQVNLVGMDLTDLHVKAMSDAVNEALK